MDKKNTLFPELPHAENEGSSLPGNIILVFLCI